MTELGFLIRGETVLNATTMVKGRPLSTDLRSVLVRMVTTCGLSLGDVCTYSGIPRRTLERLVSKFKKTGEVQGNATRRGRPRILEYSDTEVRHTVSNRFSL